MRSLALAAALVVFTAACGAKKPPKPPEPEPEFSEEETKPEAPEEKAFEPYPPPFSAEEIREATKTGRTYRFKVEAGDKPPKERVITFTKVDETGAEIFAGGEQPKRIGWSTMQKHAEFPKDRVKTREEVIKIPAGKFDCMVYEVEGDDGDVSTYYFARNLPGAPVLYFTERDGVRVKTTTLVEHIPGR